MVKAMPAGRRERGQALLESAIALPILVLMIILVVQASWTVYCAGSVAPAIAHAQSSIGLQDLDGDVDAAELIRSRMLEASPILASGELTVTGADIRRAQDATRTIELADADFNRYYIATKNESTGRVVIKAHVEFRPARLFPVLGDAAVVRDIDTSKVVDERFELG